jgi:uncharacterized membrane protein YfcA
VFAAIGFLAQMADGALGMAFGVIASTSLIALGTPPVLASAAVHAAEVATTAVSGTSHILHRNVDWPLFRRLVAPGIVGGCLGAYVLTGLPEAVVKPLVTVYLGLMALLIFARVARRMRSVNVPASTVGAVGGFLDAIGGGGWGPIVALTLLASGDAPRPTIGSVGTAEFGVTLAVSITFLTQLDLSRYGNVVLGLVLGGALAAPIAGYLVKIMPPRLLLLMVGTISLGLTAVSVAGLFG